jgi:excisionase family DNA binding protein
MATSQIPPSKRFYSLAEVERLGLGSRATIYRLRQRGELKTVRIGGKTKITAEELDRIAAGARP